MLFSNFVLKFCFKILFLNLTAIVILSFLWRFQMNSAVKKKPRCGPTDGPTNGPTDQRTDPHIEMRGRI